MEQTILYIIVGIVAFEFALEKWLDYLNKKNWSNTLPEKLKDIYNEEEYGKSQDYYFAKDKLSDWSGLIGFAVTLAMLLLGGFGWIDNWVSTFTSNPFYATLLYFAVIGIGSTIMGIPFELYGTFNIEERFGFNKMTMATYISDKLKGLFLGAIIGGALLSLFIWFHNAFPEMYWLYAWGIFMAFTLFITMFYTNLIVPLFNKLTPLEDGELRQAIEKYAQSVKFPLSNIMVVDGSKRSTKANAYFSGLGSAKNIVLFDTLVDRHSTEELVAVLAHEVGHYKKKHTLQGMVISAVVMLITLYVLHLVVDSPELSAALGATSPKLHLGLIAFSILYSPLSTVTGLLMNVFSRKNEYEADEYAAKTSSANDLTTALKRLSVDSLSNLTPHPIYSFFHYSHPPLLERLNALDKFLNEKVETA